MPICSDLAISTLQFTRQRSLVCFSFEKKNGSVFVLLLQLKIIGILFTASISVFVNDFSDLTPPVSFSLSSS